MIKRKYENRHEKIRKLVKIELRKRKKEENGLTNDKDNEKLIVTVSETKIHVKIERLIKKIILHKKQICLIFLSST